MTDYRRQVLSYARRRLSPHDAQDVAQEVAVRVWRYYSPDKGPLFNFTMHVTRSVVIDHLRAMRTRAVAGAMPVPAREEIDRERAWEIARREPVLFDSVRNTRGVAIAREMNHKTWKTWINRAQARERERVA